MKKLSFKKKSVNDEIITNEPRPVKDISIKHIFKMNFLPITFLLYSVVIIVVVLLFMAGTPDEPSEIPEGNDDSNIWTAQKLADDMVLEGGTTSITFRYGSLNDGDAIIIRDTISSISYDLNKEATTIGFGAFVGYVDDFVFQGDLTSLYATGDQVQISVTIKRVTFTLEPPDVITEITYDLEIFEKQWHSQDYFVTNMATSIKGLNVLPHSSIEKI